MIRKGLVFILTDKVEYTYNYMMSNIPYNDIAEIKTMYGQKVIYINDYRITIIASPNYISRGHKPELSYVIGNMKVPKLSDNFDLLSYLSNMSVRKEPVRKIASVEQLDIEEFLDDRYSEENYCDKRKLKRWEDIMNPKEDNIEKFKQEYDCIWVGKEDK